MKVLYVLVACFSAMVGWTLHHSIGYAILNWIFWWISLPYWLITHKLTLSVIKQTFSWFFA
jgi:hypothetical protein